MEIETSNLVDTPKRCVVRESGSYDPFLISTPEFISGMAAERVAKFCIEVEYIKY